MEKLLKFISEHYDKDVSRLILDRKKYTDIDLDLAINCIESRRKLKGKVQQWYENPRLIFPLKLSAEQCSSSATGIYKVQLAESIADGKTDWKIADLTGGLGVDSWFFAQKAGKVRYNDMQTPLYEAAMHNFTELGADNIECSCIEISSQSIHSVLDGFTPDIVYLDPARRGERGRKVFLIEECTPDVLTLKDEIFKYTQNILIKLSPMADITMVCKRLGETCREVHVIATGGECKELLIWMDREWNNGHRIIATEIHQDGTSGTFTFTPSEENSSQAIFINSAQKKFLFEPGKALMKAGAYNLISSRFGIEKLGRSTHYYITESAETAETLRQYGKLYKILECHPLDKRTIRETGKNYPKSEVTARNIPMDTDTLRKKLGITSGDDAHIFGLKSDTEGNLLIVAKI